MSERSTVPASPSTVMRCPSVITLVASRVRSTAGMRYSRAISATCWKMAPPSGVASSEASQVAETRPGRLARGYGLQPRAETSLDHDAEVQSNQIFPRKVLVKEERTAGVEHL